MIVCQLKDFSRYVALNPHFQAVLDFLKRPDLFNLEAGHYEIDGENVFANRLDYLSDGVAGKGRFETHENYLDIHLVVGGKDRIAVAPLECADLETAYEKERDIAFYTSESYQVLDLVPGNLVVAFKEDLHQPKVRYNDEPVRKLVIKVKTN